MYIGGAVAPSTNIGGTSDADTIYIRVACPSAAMREDLAKSGVGFSVWGGGEYQHPLGERLRLRLGGERIAPGILG